MNDRRQILEDKEFWSALEFVLSAWFRSCGDRSLGGIWCDGISPSRASDTKHGIAVFGHAWIGEGSRKQHEFAFSASIPQRLLARRRHDVVLKDVEFDLERKKLSFTVEPAFGVPDLTSRNSNDESVS
jgi:hypothetical protein